MRTYRSSNWKTFGDLTNFLGIPGDFTSKIYLNAINKIVMAAKAYNKSLGIMVNNRHELEYYSKLDFNIIAVGTEMSILTKSISQMFRKLVFRKLISNSNV